MTPQYADISGFQSVASWAAYKQWAAGFDGTARVAIKATEGVGYTDAKYHEFRAGAGGSGISQILHYHFARPDLGNIPQAEAEWLFKVTGAIGADDIIMLDYEGYGSVTAPFTAEWALAWLQHAEQLYGRAPWLYTYRAFIPEHLQNSALAQYPLIMADYTYDPAARPACPAPWKSYVALQFSDKATVPGIGQCDCNVYLGGTSMPIPTGWHDDGQKLTAPNGHYLVLGFRQHVLSAPSWDAGNQPNEEQYEANPVLLHNTAVGAGQRVTLRDCELWYTAAHGVVQEPYSGLELKACYDLIASQQAEIAALKAAQPTPAPVDTSTVETDINAIVNEVTSAIASTSAKALADLKKL